MQQNNEIICVIDYVGDDEFDGKSFKRITTKAGEEYRIGKRLESKWDLLQPGTPLVLYMDVFKGNLYVKDFARCLDVTQEKMAELSKPAPRNPKDVSIERQVAVKCVVDLMAAKVEVPDDLKDMAINWLRNAIKGE